MKALPILAGAGAKIGAEVIGEGIEAGGRIIAGTIQGVGTAIGGAAQGMGTAIGGALQGVLTEGPKTIVNNVGIAGSAGKQNIVSGGGTLPAPKKAAKPAYNDKMPTEKLLAVAVSYLASIDSTLRTQIENDRLAFQKKAQAEKEASVEGKDTNIFKKLGEGLGAVRDYAKEKANKFDVAGKLIKGGLLLGGLGAIGISKLDTAELDALKANVNAFKREYEWLIDIASVASGAATGFMIGGAGGPWGRILGAIAGGLVALGFRMDNKRDKFRERGTRLFSENAKAKAEEYFKRRSLLMNQIAGDPTKKGATATIRAYMQGTAGSAEDVQFLKDDLKKQGYSDAQIDAILFGTQDQLKDANIVTANPPTSDTPRAVTGQESYVPSGDQKVDFAMQYLMKNLGISQFQASGIIANLMAESGLDTNAFNEAGGGRGAYGIAQWRGPRQDGLDAYAKSLGKRRDDFETQLGWLVQEMKTTHKSALSALKATTNSADATTVVLDKYERPSAADRNSSLKKRISYGMAAERGTSLSTAQSTYEEPAALAAQARGASEDATGFSIESALSMAKNIFGKAGAAIIGAENYTARPITENIGDPSKKILDMSKKIETAMIAGKEQEISQPGAVAATASQQSIMQASNDGSLAALDPNYPGGKDTIMTYLAHWKFAA